MNILNYIKILIFYIIYNKVKKIISVKDNLNVKTTKALFENKYSYNIFQIKNATLHNASVHDCAIISENKLIDEASYQYRYNKEKNIFNGPSSENITLKNGTPRYRKKISGSVLSTLTGGAGKHNYFHWLFDVLPRIAILENNKKIDKPDYYLLPSLKHTYQKQTLKKLNIPLSKLLDGEKNKHFSCDKLYVVDHPYNFNNNPSKSISNIPQWIISWLKEKCEFDNIKNQSYFDKIYIDRSDSLHKEKRFLTNNHDVREYLKSIDFKILKLSELSFTEQVETFKNAKIIVGLHGAGFANIIFSRPGTKIIELQSSTAGDVIRNIALQCNLNYKKISKESRNLSLTHMQGDINIDLKELEKVIFDK